MPDTTICATDTLNLWAQTDGLRFIWSPAGSLDNPNIPRPRARPLTTTTYELTAIIGGCSVTDDVTVNLVPYPMANAGPDTTVCFQTPAQLHASMVANSFSWTPTNSLSDPNILDPIARPRTTMAYILTVRDILGCPKPVKDTVVVTVLPEMQVSGGRDTAVVVGQPLQLQASGGMQYLWVPAIGLNNPNIVNPVGTYDGSFEYITYMLYAENEIGCRDSATVTIRVFKTNPQIFVPTAFTPNGDNRNDRFTFVPVGITKIDYFRVYNRWGQLVYSSVSHMPGWDGRIGGKEQGSGVFVWIVKGSDFTGKTITAKGTVTLIR
jgi:gliding motility-associated-like protein